MDGMERGWRDGPLTHPRLSKFRVWFSGMDWSGSVACRSGPAALADTRADSRMVCGNCLLLCDLLLADLFDDSLRRARAGAGLPFSVTPDDCGRHLSRSGDDARGAIGQALGSCGFTARAGVLDGVRVGEARYHWSTLERA